MGGLSCGTRGVGGQEAPSPKLPWLFELRCPRRLALVGPRKAVKARSNGRNNSRGKLRPLLLREKAVKTREISSLATQKTSLAHTA